METSFRPARGRGFLSQLALMLGQPKAIAFFVALLPTVIDLNRLNVFGYLQLVRGDVRADPGDHAVLCGAGLPCARLPGERAKRAAASTGGAAVIMVGAGVGVAVS